MKQNTVFYRCPICGNLIGLIDGNPDTIICCGQRMKQLIANTSDAATEKHVPTYEVQGDEIIAKIGSIEHPMDVDHYIMWIAQVSKNRTTRVRLHPGDKPEARFEYIKGAKLYAYCNKHSLWMSEVE